MKQVKAMAARGNGGGDAVFLAVEDDRGHAAVFVCYMNNDRTSDWTQLPPLPDVAAQESVR